MKASASPAPGEYRRPGRSPWHEYQGRQRTAGEERAARNRARAADLDELRLTRPLSEAEQREANILSCRIYMHEWRAAQREREQALRVHPLPRTVVEQRP